MQDFMPNAMRDLPRSSLEFFLKITSVLCCTTWRCWECIYCSTSLAWTAKRSHCIELKLLWSNKTWHQYDV